MNRSEYLLIRVEQEMEVARTFLAANEIDLAYFHANAAKGYMQRIKRSTLNELASRVTAAYAGQHFKERLMTGPMTETLKSLIQKNPYDLCYRKNGLLIVPEYVYDKEFKKA